MSTMMIDDEVTVSFPGLEAERGVSHSIDRSYLDLLARAKAALEGSREVAVGVDDLRPFPDQPRKYFDEGGIARLRDSISGSGQTTSGLIREKVDVTRYELIDGERRWRAVRMIPVASRPLYKARLIAADDDVVRYLISGIANFNREGHTPLEVSDTIDRLLSFKLPMREIAALLGISEHWGYQMHGLRKLVPGARGLLDPTLPRAKRLPVSAAIEISKVSTGLQLQLARRVVAREISLAGLRAEAVAVSRKARVPIREREVPRDERWKGLRRKIGIAELAVADAVRVAGFREVKAFARQRPEAERRELVARLRALQGSVATLAAAIRGAE